MSNALPAVTPKKIMLVEDDHELASLISDFLIKYEFDVSIVGDGIEAVQRIINEQPALVILDVMLPGQTGMDVCRQVRSSGTDAAQSLVPPIVMSLEQAGRPAK